MHSSNCSCHSHDGFLTVRGYAENAQRELGLYGLDAMAPERYLDKVGSVSGPELERDLYEMVSDTAIDEQARRFHYGS